MSWNFAAYDPKVTSLNPRSAEVSGDSPSTQLGHMQGCRDQHKDRALD